MLDERQDDIYTAPQEKLEKEQAETAQQERPRQLRGAGFGGGQHGATVVEKPKNGKQTFRRLLTYVKPFKWRFLLVILFSALGAVLTAFGPHLSGMAINAIQDGISPSGAGGFVLDIQMQAFITVVITVGLAYTLGALCSFASSYTVAGVSQKMMYGLRNEIKAKLDKLPLRYFDGRQYGETLSRMTNDIDTVQSTLQQNLTQLINAVFTLISVIVMMTINSWIVTLICLATLPIALIATIFIAKRSQKYFKAQSKNLGILNGHIEEMYSGYKIVKSYNLEQSSLEKFNDTNGELYKSAVRSQFMAGMTQPLLSLVNYVNYAAVIVVGGLLVINGRLDGIGNITAMLQYSNRFAMPIQTTAQFVNVIQNALAAAERVFEVLDAEEEDCNEYPSVNEDGIKGNVCFKNVEFSYVPGTELIKDMNLKISPGDSVAIVGPTGAGKTTLVNLLMRFYDIGGGQIFIDDTDISKADRHSVRGLFGMVLQDTWLFKGTIKDNIKFGNLEATDEEVADAASQARAHDFIVKLPKGYDSELNEDATNISNGQRQLLTIARALISQPKILILDEATSSVDTRTEQHIQVAMTQMMKNRTSFVIAHRLSTIKNAKTILVMNKGRVIEQGNHEELLAKKGFYFDLYNSQFNKPLISDQSFDASQCTADA
jgi:ATP-binding cassette subfamily B protein